MLQLLQNTQQKHQNVEELKKIHSSLKDLKQAFLLALLYQEVQDISNLQITDEDVKQLPASTDKSNQDVLPAAETVNFLNKNTDVNRRRNPNDPGQIDYLLSRPTENYEYQQGAEKTSFNKYKNLEQNEWFIQTNSAQNNQYDENPVITCWIPEKSIAGTPTPHKNTGTWGEHGDNPFEEHIIVLVEPGEYEVYSSLNENSGHSYTKQSIDHQRQEGQPNSSPSLAKSRIIVEKLNKIKHLNQELRKSVSANTEGGFHREDDFPAHAFDNFINYFEHKHASGEDVNMNKQWKKVLVQMLTHPEISKEQEAQAQNSTCPHIASVARVVLCAKNSQKPQKSNLSEDLDKVYYVNNRPFPEDSDVNQPHPTDRDKVGHQTADSQKNVWAHTPELVEHHKSEILRNFNKLGLSQPGKKNLVNLMTHLWDDPDAGVMVSGTTPGSQGDFSELRVRHLHNAAKGRFGYQLKEQQNGNIQIHAPRHSKGTRSDTSKTVWTWDGNTLKSEHKDPIGNTIAQGEYNYGKKQTKTET